MLTLPPIPDKYDSRAISDAFSRVETEMNALLTLEVLRSAPQKPRTGMLVIADGANWDPGSGTGTYVYLGSWRRLDG
jgi:hypothetical protein